MFSFLLTSCYVDKLGFYIVTMTVLGMISNVVGKIPRTL